MNDTSSKEVSDLDKIRIEVMLSEYRELYEHIRHKDRTIEAQDAIFITLSFAILAYTVGQNLSFSDLISAAIASLAIFIFTSIHARRLNWRGIMEYKRIGEIEEELCKFTQSKSIIFQTDFRKNIEKAMKRTIHKKPYELLFPGVILEKMSQNLRVRSLRVAMLGALLVMWGFRIA